MNDELKKQSANEFIREVDPVVLGRISEYIDRAYKEGQKNPSKDTIISAMKLGQDTERKRCAEIARNMISEPKDYLDTQHNFTCKAIATAIEKGEV